MSDLLKINVNEHTERKNGLTYLSWAWAWAEVLKIDPQAEWEAVEYQQPDGTVTPCMYVGEGSAIVKTKVTIKGKVRTCHLPVMDHRNKAIKNPDAFAINTAIMRCMTKAISMHGLGLYIYAGEDLPEDAESTETIKEAIDRTKAPIRATEGADAGLTEERKAVVEETAAYLIDAHKSGKDMDAIRVWYAEDTFQHSEERIYCWDLLKTESKLRSTIKANKPT